MKRTSLRLSGIAFALLLSGFLAGLVLTGRFRSADTMRAEQPPPRAPGTAAPSVAASSLGVAGVAGVADVAGVMGLPDLTGIAAEAVKGVVNISSVQVVRTPNSPFVNDPFFQYFFGGSDELFGSRDRRELSLGSGVLVSRDGYVVTNNHVVGSHGQEVTVAFGDKHELPAKIIGVDSATDIALLKIAPVSQPTVPWGDSDALKVAEWVLAIGSPYQLNQTVTLGIVSAIRRANVGISEIEDFIQTDAAINPGNSGGALINTRGQLVGINTAILSQSGGYQGIGFAIPSNLARGIIDELIKYGEVRRGSIGNVILFPLTTQIAEQVGVSDTRGALVDRMERRSPAFDGGVRPGDVIMSFNGQAVENPSHLVKLVASARIGSTATLGIIRESRRLTLQISIVQREG